jgi:DNA-binding transcriptional regulator PaaX
MSQYKIENDNISEKIMRALSLGFIIPAVLTSPFALYAIIVGGTRYYFRRYQFNRELKRLKDRGYVSLVKSSGSLKIRLLSKGRLFLKKLDIENLSLPKSKKWDGRWRMFIFDIPEEFRNERNLLRRKLKLLGCYNIQRSTFVYPYPCQKELESVAGYYEVSKYTLYAETVYIDIGKELKKYFGV